MAVHKIKAARRIENGESGITLLPKTVASQVECTVSDEGGETTEISLDKLLDKKVDEDYVSKLAFTGKYEDLTDVPIPFDIVSQGIYPITLFDVDENGKAVRNANGDGEYVVVSLPNGEYRLRKIGRID